MWKCNIEALIRESRLKKDYIAEKIKVSPRQLRKYEKFELFIPTEKGLLLGKLLNCRFEYCYKLSDNK